MEAVTENVTYKITLNWALSWNWKLWKILKERTIKESDQAIDEGQKNLPHTLFCQIKKYRWILQNWNPQFSYQLKQTSDYIKNKM